MTFDIKDVPFFCHHISGEPLDNSTEVCYYEDKRYFLRCGHARITFFLRTDVQDKLRRREGIE